MKATRCNDNVPKSIPRYPVGRLVGHDGPIQTVVFTADGKYCLTGGADRTVRLWNPSRLDPAYAKTTTTNNNKIDTLVPEVDEDVSIGTKKKSTTTNDRINNQLFEWDTLQRTLPIQIYRDGYTHPISSIAVSDEDFDYFNNNKKQQQPLQQNTQKWLLVAYDKTAALTDVVSGTTVRRFRGHYGRINRVAFSAGAETYLTASYDATVRIWDGRNRNCHEPIQILNDAKDSVTAVHTVQPQQWQQNSGNFGRSSTVDASAKIVTGSVDGCVRTYDLRRGIIQCDDCGSPVMDISPTYDGQCLAISCLDGKIRLIDNSTGELVNMYNSGHVAGNYGLECYVSTDDTSIITGSENGDVVLYDIVRADVIQTLTGHTAPTCSIACHPNRSDVIITASYDGKAVIWANDYTYIK